MARPNPFQSLFQQQTDSLFPDSGIKTRRLQDEERQREQEKQIPKRKAPFNLNDPRFKPSLPKDPTGRIKVVQADTGITTDAVSPRQSFFEGMVKRGMPPIAAAGFTGGVEQESRFNPLTTGDIDPKTGEPRSFGAFQVQKSRRTAFFEFAKAANKDPNNIETQMDFAMEEFRTTEQPAQRALFGATTVEEAALATNRFFRPSKPVNEERLRNALKVQLGENVVLGAPGSSAPPVAPVPLGPAPAAVLPVRQLPASERVPVPAPRARAPAPLRASVPLPKPSTPVSSPPAVRRENSVPVVWQQAVAKFLQSRDPKDLSGVPEGSLAVIMLLMGQSARGIR